MTDIYIIYMYKTCMSTLMNSPIHWIFFSFLFRVCQFKFANVSGHKNFISSLVFVSSSSLYSIYRYFTFTKVRSFHLELEILYHCYCYHSWSRNTAIQLYKYQNYSIELFLILIMNCMRKVREVIKYLKMKSKIS